MKYLFLFCILLLFSCSENEILDLTYNKEIENKKKDYIIWDLDQMNETSCPGPNISLMGSSFSAFGGCNSGRGELKFGNKTVQFKNLTVTSMACPGKGLLQKEAQFFSMLNRMENWDWNGSDTLILSAKNDSLKFRKRQMVNDSSLEKTVWNVNAVFLSGAVGSMYAESKISFRLEDGKIKGNGTCGDFGGAYSLNNNELRITDLKYFPKKCEIAEIQKQEQYFYTVIRRIDRYSIEKNVMNLYIGSERVYSCITKN